MRDFNFWGNHNDLKKISILSIYLRSKCDYFNFTHRLIFFENKFIAEALKGHFNLLSETILDWKQSSFEDKTNWRTREMFKCAFNKKRKRARSWWKPLQTKSPRDIRYGLEYKFSLRNELTVRFICSDTEFNRNIFTITFL